MNGKEVITHAVRGEMPDIEQMRKNIIEQATKKTKIKTRCITKTLYSCCRMPCYCVYIGDYYTV